MSIIYTIAKGFVSLWRSWTRRDECGALDLFSSTMNVFCVGVIEEAIAKYGCPKSSI